MVEKRPGFASGNDGCHCFHSLSSALRACEMVVKTTTTICSAVSRCEQDVLGVWCEVARNGCSVINEEPERDDVRAPLLSSSLLSCGRSLIIFLSLH